MLFWRRARNAPEQVDERRAVYGRELTGQLEGDAPILTLSTLRVHFEDGSSQLIDFRPVLKGELYGPLRDRALFEQVVIDQVAHTLVWPNDADFDPATLYSWPDSGPRLAELAETWTVPAT